MNPCQWGRANPLHCPASLRRIRAPITSAPRGSDLPDLPERPERRECQGANSTACRAGNAGSAAPVGAPTERESTRVLPPRCFARRPQRPHRLFRARSRQPNRSSGRGWRTFCEARLVGRLLREPWTAMKCSAFWCGRTSRARELQKQAKFEAAALRPFGVETVVPAKRTAPRWGRTSKRPGRCSPAGWLQASKRKRRSMCFRIR